MVPRRVVVALNIDAPPEVILGTLSTNNYTRVPVYENGSDNFVGVLDTKDFATELAKSGSLPALRSVVRPIVSVAESATAGQLLAMLRKEHAHQALVIGEFGVRGLVTFGDVLAELMGGMSGKGRFGQPPPMRLPDGRVRLPGFLRIEDAAEFIGVPLKVNAATVAGLVLHTAGHLPKPGEEITVGDVQFEVERVEHQAILTVVARRLEAKGMR
jgi:putative hemolysin